MSLRSVFTLCALVILPRYQEVTAQENCILSNTDQKQCSLSCYQSMKSILQYIVSLEEEIEDLDDQISVARIRSGSDQRNLNCNNLASGTHKIQIEGNYSFHVVCDADLAGGGWIVVLNRFDGSENFNRNWISFRNGFGKLDGEFFFGLESLHLLTHSHPHELYVRMIHFNDTVLFARYDNFKIGNEAEKYMLESLGEFTGTAGDEMSESLNRKFTTYDDDNDEMTSTNCAAEFYGAWWYRTCGGPNLNGRYYKDGNIKTDGMSWNAISSLKAVQMLIRRRS